MSSLGVENLQTKFWLKNPASIWSKRPAYSYGYLNFRRSRLHLKECPSWIWKSVCVLRLSQASESQERNKKQSLEYKKKLNYTRIKYSLQSVHTIFQNKILYLAQASIPSTVPLLTFTGFYFTSFLLFYLARMQWTGININMQGYSQCFCLDTGFFPFAEDARTIAGPSPLPFANPKEVAPLIIPSICHQNAHYCCSSDLQEFPVDVLD